MKEGSDHYVGEGRSGERWGCGSSYAVNGLEVCVAVLEDSGIPIATWKSRRGECWGGGGGRVEANNGVRGGR